MNRSICGSTYERFIIFNHDTLYSFYLKKGYNGFDKHDILKPFLHEVILSISFIRDDEPVILTDQGNIYYGPSDNNQYQKIDIPFKIKYMNNSYIIDYKNDLYTYVTDYTISKPLYFHSNVYMVACGSFHTLFLTYDGICYGLGRNNDGQLCHKNLHQINLPLTIIIPNETIRYIACGMEHSVCLTRNNNVYTWGSNRRGQLGKNYINDVLIISN